MAEFSERMYLSLFWLKALTLPSSCPQRMAPGLSTTCLLCWQQSVEAKADQTKPDGLASGSLALLLTSFVTLNNVPNSSVAQFLTAMGEDKSAWAAI